MTATAPSSVVFSDSLMGSLIRSYDWSQHEFGPLASWPPELLSAVNLLLDCQLPAHLWWGPNHCSLYNDAYVNIVGRKHPSLLGAPGKPATHNVNRAQLNCRVRGIQGRVVRVGAKGQRHVRPRQDYLPQGLSPRQ